MVDFDRAFSGFLLFGLVIALAGIGVAGVAVYWTIGGAPVETAPDPAERLGAPVCEPHDAEPAFEPDTSYGAALDADAEGVLAVDGGDDGTVTVTVETTPFNATTSPFAPATDDGPAAGVDGSTVPVEPTTEPYRLWIDAADEDGEVIRHRLDVCPEP